MLEQFKTEYVNKVLNGNGFDDELNMLFNKVIEEEFHGNALAMDDLIYELNGYNTQDNAVETLQNQVDYMSKMINRLAYNQS